MHTHSAPEADNALGVNALPLLGCDEDHLAGGCIGDGLCAFEAEHVNKHRRLPLSIPIIPAETGTQWVQVAIGATSAQQTVCNEMQ